MVERVREYRKLDTLEWECIHEVYTVRDEIKKAKVDRNDEKVEELVLKEREILKQVDEIRRNKNRLGI